MRLNVRSVFHGELISYAYKRFDVLNPYDWQVDGGVQTPNDWHKFATQYENVKVVSYFIRIKWNAFGDQMYNDGFTAPADSGTQSYSTATQRAYQGTFDLGTMLSEQTDTYNLPLPVTVNDPMCRTKYFCSGNRSHTLTRAWSQKGYTKDLSNSAYVTQLNGDGTVGTLAPVIVANSQRPIVYFYHKASQEPPAQATYAKYVYVTVQYKTLEFWQRRVTNNAG